MQQEPSGAIPTSIPVTTAFEFPEWKIERHIGSCFGLVVRSMGAIKGIGASFKALRGGEVTQYTELLEDSRRHAIDRMVENARLMGANAIVAMRFDNGSIGQAFTEVCAYGTAVVVEPIPAGEPGSTDQSAHFAGAASQPYAQPSGGATPSQPAQAAPTFAPPPPPAG